MTSALRAQRAFVVTGTGTDVGKTLVGTALLRALRSRGVSTGALKPFETGCHSQTVLGGVDRPDSDAGRLARAAGLAPGHILPGFFRAELPLAPYAALLGADATLGELGDAGAASASRRVQYTNTATISLPCIQAACVSFAESFDVTLVEGAGGVAVPLTARHTSLDFFSQLGWPLILIAADQLGTLSHTLTACWALRSARLPLLAVVLVRPPAVAGAETRLRHEGARAALAAPAEDPSQVLNAPILREYLDPLPVFSVAGAALIADPDGGALPGALVDLCMPQRPPWSL